MLDTELSARASLFKEVLEAYTSHNNKVLIQAATGSGKTKMAIDLAENTGTRWTILVPKKPLVQTWKDEIVKWGYKDFLEKIDVLCYASAHKLPAGNNDIILDEAHRVTERSQPFIKAFVGTGKVIALSATVSKQKKLLLEDLGIERSNTIRYTLDDAVADDLVADYNIRIIQFPLDNQKKTVEAGTKLKKFYTTELQGYIYKDQMARQAMYSQNQQLIKFRKIDRMRFIYNLPSKLELTQKVLELLPQDKKIIIFCGSIDHANIVCAHRFHSKSSDVDYKAFCEGKINRLSVVQSVAEGVNIPELDYAILMQVQSDKLHTIQKVGRLVRKNQDAGKVGQVIILEALGTQDSVWVKKAMLGFDATKINYISSSQLLNHGL
jgi:superfamily II DNA or RNA helicase